MKKFYSISSIVLIMALLSSTFVACAQAVPPKETEIPDSYIDPEAYEELAQNEEEDEDTGKYQFFPKGSVILGHDISYLDPGYAYEMITDELAAYQLTVTVNGKTKTYSAQDFAVTLSVTDFRGLLKELGDNPDALNDIDKELLVYDADSVIEAAENFPGITSTAKNAYIQYDKSSKRFVAKPEVNGYGIDTQPVIKAIGEAIMSGNNTIDLKISPSNVVPNITKDCDKMTSALARANSLLDLSITYIFNPATGTKHTDKLSSSEIASLLYVKKDGITVAVDKDSLDRFCSKKASQRGVFGQSVTFTTSTGQSITNNAISTGELVDTNDLYDDLNYRLSNAKSGTHSVAYYVVRPGDVSGNYNGNYVEVNLTTQHAWCYRNGKLVVSTSIVSGCVRAGHRTPTGVFTIRGKARNTYLVGPTWKSYVSYWMPFNGGIGLHDADRWRKNYGGTIYLRNGSHGCVNMPLTAARTMYNNVSRGTHVIVYGGSGSASPQAISGSTLYTCNVGDSPFYVDATPKYTATLTFKSNNNSVATVNSAGRVTIVGKGTAVITASITGESCKLNITISVLPKGVTPSPTPIPGQPTATPPTASPASATPGGGGSDPTATPPTADPTSAPTSQPTSEPTSEPTAKPTAKPTDPPENPPADEPGGDEG